MPERTLKKNGCANTLLRIQPEWFDEISLPPRINYNFKGWQLDFILQLSSIKSTFFFGLISCHPTNWLQHLLVPIATTIVFLKKLKSYSAKRKLKMQMYLISYCLLIFSGDECQKGGREIISQQNPAMPTPELDFSSVMESIIKLACF